MKLFNEIISEFEFIFNYKPNTFHFNAKYKIYSPAAVTCVLCNPP